MNSLKSGCSSYVMVPPQPYRKFNFDSTLANTFGVVLVHNHPSEDPAPSSDDKRMTEQLHQAAKVLDISMYDHIIIAKNGYSSWAEGWDSHAALSDFLPF